MRESPSEVHEMKDSKIVESPLGYGKVEVLRASDMFNGDPEPRRER